MNDNLQSLIDDYQKPTETTTTSKKTFLTKEEKSQKKFSLKSDEEQIRLIPHPSGKYFEDTYFHTVTIGTITTKIPCLHKNFGKDCPLCKREKEILQKQQESGITDEQKKQIFKDSLKFKPTLFKMVKLIDRGSVKDGVKFYQIKHSKLKETDPDTVYDKIMKNVIIPNSKNGVNFADSENGVDIILNTQDKKAGYNTYKEVTNVTSTKPCRLSDNENQAKKWLEDKTKWEDVFPMKTVPGYTAEQYMQSIVEGNTPIWNSETKQFEVKNKPVSEKANNLNQSLDLNTSLIDLTSNIDIDDLPF